MSEEKVSYKELRQATVHVDNSVDAGKVYDIGADVRVNSTTVEGYDNGTVAKDGVQVATFSCWNGDASNLNINFQGVESEGQCAVLEAVNGFFGDVKAKVESAVPLSI